MRFIFVLSVCCAALMFRIMPRSTEESVASGPDVMKFGFHLRSENELWVDYSCITFLSNDRLLLTINQREFQPGANEAFKDQPNSLLLLVDLNGRVLSQTSMPTEKSPNAVQAAFGGRFVIWNRSGIQVCDTDFRCGSPLTARTLALVSPRGTTATIKTDPPPVGGNGWGEVQVINLKTMTSLQTLPERLEDKSFPLIVPGDDLLLIYNSFKMRMLIEQGSGSNRTIRLNNTASQKLLEIKFLSQQNFAALAFDLSRVVVEDLDGHELYRLPLATRTTIVPTREGERFGLYEYGYSILNSIINFLDIGETRAKSFQRLRIFRTAGGFKVADYEWAPGPYLIKPALSPDGRKLARISKAGVLEILSVP